MTDQDSPIMAALQQFEAAEANLIKLERLWSEIHELTPSGVSFGNTPEYEDKCRAYGHILAALPMIDDWKPQTEPMDLNEIGQWRFDAMEIGEPTAHFAIEEQIELPGKELRDYRFRLTNARKALIRDSLVELIDQIDGDIRLLKAASIELETYQQIPLDKWSDIRSHARQIDVLLGSAPKPDRWSDLFRHISFGLVGDLNDIERLDWPQAKGSLRKGLYGVNEPIPVAVSDLSDVIRSRPKGSIATKLNWSNLDDEGFERLIFALISNEPGYENPEWLMNTNAPDRGRDLSVTRVAQDGLSGTFRFRVIIQCKHWQTRSVSPSDVATLKTQMELWANPRVDVLIIATSGRFTAGAVQLIERHNDKGESPKIEMWAESHLEKLLASRPALIAEFRLRQIG